MKFDAIDTVYHVVIHSIQQEAYGVCHIDGRVVYVPDALPGERVRIRIERTTKGISYATVLERLTTSAQRTDAPCTVYGACGGCVWQHATYAAQLQWKRDHVMHTLQRIGGVDCDAITVHETVGMNVPWAYRNKIQLVAGRDESGKTTIGFYARYATRIVAPTQCLIVHPRITEAMHAIQTVIQQHNPTPYDRNTHTGWLRHIIIRVSETTNQLMIMIVVATKPRKQIEWIEHLYTHISGVVTIVQNIHPTKSTTHSGQHATIVSGPPTMTECIGGIAFSFSPRAFLQINTTQTERLIAIVRACACVQPTHIVCDAYCGIGTFALTLARDAAHVYAIEWMPEAIEDARNNAKQNGIANVTFTVGDVADVLGQLPPPNVLILDPPRSGCASHVLDAVAQIAPPRIVYVSCAPATLARDVRKLAATGYAIEEVWPVDVFPQTEHVECVVLLEKK